ncbi:MAG: sugar phosphate isomerase/epimerase [Chitinophagaceae bacterium]|nr:sugar phosphate isomerase/epimerase [Chitinophagaceae bacterium]
MTYNRRFFLKNSGLLASGIALAGIGCASSSNKEEAGTKDSTGVGADSTASKVSEHALAQFGLQLYTLRDDMPKDPKGVMKQAAAFGYKQFEGFEGDKGIFWGMKNTEFKKYLDGLGVTMVSSHCNTDKDFERKAAEAGEIGMKYLLRAWVGPQKTVDDYKKFADKFNQWGDICKKHGIRFGYHNHDYSFKQIDGQYPQDIFMKNTNQETVDYEMDIYWVITGGADPVEWLKKYPNRFRLCHIKDRKKGAAADDKDASVDVGTGSVDFKKILRIAEDNGMQYYIVEQEKYENTTPLKSAEVAADYLKNFRY